MPGSISNPLRVLSFGAGAIGTYIGGSLALDGHAVTFLDRRRGGTERARHAPQAARASQSHPEAQPGGFIGEAITQGPFDVGIPENPAIPRRRWILATGDLPPILCLREWRERMKHERRCRTG
jgi:2-dehydropantoate 2-reductase